MWFEIDLERESGYSQLNTSRSSKEGGLLWDSHGVAKDDPLVKDIAGGGVGSELLHFGYIRSNARSQSVDRELGGFKDFAEVLDSADKLADDLEGPLKPLYAFTLQRMLVGEGFDDINAYIRSGHHISTILKSLN